MKLPILAAGLALLLAQVSCGGGGGGSTAAAPALATGLAYTDPSSGSYRLVRNATQSTSTHLVLDLMGPATTGCGVSVTLTAGSQVQWVNVGTGDPAGTYIADGTQFALGSAPQIFKAKVSGNTLKATVAEKGYSSPKSLDGALMRVALDFRTGLGTRKGATVSLTPGTCKVLDGSGNLQTITLTPGTLTCE